MNACGVSHAYIYMVCTCGMLHKRQTLVYNVLVVFVYAYDNVPCYLWWCRPSLVFTQQEARRIRSIVQQYE